MLTDLLTIADAAARTGLSVATIRRMLTVGMLDYCRFGRSVRIPTSEVERLIASARVPARHN